MPPHATHIPFCLSLLQSNLKRWLPPHFDAMRFYLFWKRKNFLSTNFSRALQFKSQKLDALQLAKAELTFQMDFAIQKAKFLICTPIVWRKLNGDEKKNHFKFLVPTKVSCLLLYDEIETNRVRHFEVSEKSKNCNRYVNEKRNFFLLTKKKWKSAPLFFVQCDKQRGKIGLQTIHTRNWERKSKKMQILRNAAGSDISKACDNQRLKSLLRQVMVISIALCMCVC